MQKQTDIPEGFEKIDHHDTLDLHHPEKGIIITILERDRITQNLTGRYPYRVIVSQNQKSLYDGSFQSESHAEQKVIELANKYAD